MVDIEDEDPDGPCLAELLPTTVKRKKRINPPGSAKQVKTKVYKICPPFALKPCPPTRRSPIPVTKKATANGRTIPVKIKPPVLLDEDSKTSSVENFGKYDDVPDYLESENIEEDPLYFEALSILKDKEHCDQLEDCLNDASDEISSSDSLPCLQVFDEAIDEGTIFKLKITLSFIL